MNVKNLIFVCCVTGLCLACSPRAIREARDVVAQADSLWHAGQMYGMDAGDSATLAQAYETLGKFSVFSIQLSEIFPFGHRTSSPGTYAHACYHYGRLLRAKEDPVAAMQVFINATHSHTRDYHILGRVYSNMGSICHLAGEFPLSYDMYKKSAQVFLQGGDTLSYYYLLNDMAFELTMLSEKDSAFIILNRIEKECLDSDIRIKILETKAEACLKVQKYDSALHYALETSHNSLGILLRAQAYSYVGIKDSAVYYAKQLLELSSNLADKHNALYILTNDDERNDKTSIREIASKRADNQKLMEIQHGECTQATLLLKQDQTLKPDLRWLYFVAAITLFGGSVIILSYIGRKRKQHQRIILDLKEKEETYNHLSRTINDLSSLQDTQHQQLIADIEEVCLHIKQSKDLRAELSWGNYEQMCTMINRRMYGMADRLQSFSLAEKEVRLCILVLLQAETEQMVDMIPYARSGLGKFKYTTARKLGTTTANLRVFILNLVT